MYVELTCMDFQASIEASESECVAKYETKRVATPHFSRAYADQRIDVQKNLLLEKVAGEKEKISEALVNDVIGAMCVPQVIREDEDLMLMITIGELRVEVRGGSVTLIKPRSSLPETI